jgi:broad specificity polyphosphatase/5'/3'-nucleotidase SurE
MSETQQLQVEYWTAFEQRLAAAKGAVKARKVVSGGWVAHAIGKSGVSLNTAMNTLKNRIRVDLYLSGPRAKANYGKLVVHKDSIESTIGAALDWQLRPDRPESRISLAKEGCDPRQRSEWASQHDWLVATILKFHRGFHPFVGLLNQSGMGADE